MSRRRHAVSKLLVQIEELRGIDFGVQYGLRKLLKFTWDLKKVKDLVECELRFWHKLKSPFARGVLKGLQSVRKRLR